MAHAHPIYDTNKRFVVDAATKNIAMSEANKPVLVQYDNYSEVITFEVDRFVEGHDLSLSSKVEVHYNNIDTTGRRTSKGLYVAEDLKIDPDNPAKVLVSWFISEEATKYEGTLNFVLSFSCLEDDVFNVYRWNSHIGVFNVGAGINNTEYLEQQYADVLEMWKQTLFGIGDTEEARMLNLSQRLRDDLDLHAQQVTESMPQEYMDYSAFEKTKANVDDINRLFENDWILSNRTNYFPYGDSSFEYTGTATNSFKIAGGTFNLEEGRYKLVIPDTNAIGIYVMRYDNEARLLELKEFHIGIHDFIVPSEFANVPLVIMYYAAISAANTAGTYYLKRPYIFKSDEDGILSNGFFTKGSNKFFESDLVRSQIGDNLYTSGDIRLDYDGKATYKTKVSGRFFLEPGDYTLTILDSNAVYFMIVPYPGTGNAPRLVTSKTRPENIRFTVGEEYRNTPLLLSINASLATANPAGEYYAKSIYIHKDTDKCYFPEFIVNNISRNIKNGGLSANKQSLSAGSTLEIDATCDVKNNKSLTFTADFSTFGGLRVGHGKTSYGGSYIDITSSNIDIYQYTDKATRVSTSAHGLTFSSFVSVVINVGVAKADVTIFTANGSYTVKDVSWSGYNGKIFAEAVGGNFTNCEMKWIPADVCKKVWVFGDSYLGFNDSRWAGQIHNLGYKNWLACGYPGAKSSAELASFKTLMAIGKPDIVLWCLGMNDGDNGVINSSWLSCVEEVITLCHDKNITPILATIPTCPSIDNTYKNEWVKNSGHRYVDLNKAVGVSGTSWYSGMLSSDNVHPTELGAKVLAARVCVDVPEIMQ